MYDFAVHECTQEQNGSPNFSSIVRQIDKLTETPFRGVAVKLRKTVEIREFCNHG